MSLTIVPAISPTNGFTLSNPQTLRQFAFARTNIDPGPFDVVGITLPRLKNDTSGLQTVTANGFFHNVGGVLRLNLVQEVVISDAISPCQQTVVLQHERGHVRDNEAIMPLMDHALPSGREITT